MSQKKKTSPPQAKPPLTQKPQKTEEVLVEKKESFRTMAQKELIQFGKIALLVVPGIFVLSASLVGTDMLLNGRIMPGTTLGGVPLAFAYKTDAANLVQPAVDNYLNTPFSIAINGQQTQLTPQELGVQVSVPETVLSLPAYDFRKDNLLSLLFSSIAPQNETAFVNFNADKAQNVVEQKMDLQKYRAQDAHIIFDSNKTPAVLAEIQGDVLNRDQLINGLQTNAETLKSSPLALDFIPEMPTVTAQDLQSQKEFMGSTLTTPIELVYQGQQWKFDPSKHLDAIDFTQDPTVTIKSLHLTLPIVLGNTSAMKNNDNIVITQKPSMILDQQKINDFLQQQIIAKIDQPTSDVKIYTDANKNIVIDGKGENGVEVSPDGLVASLNLALNNNIKSLEVPTMEEKAKVTVSPDLQNLGIKNLIATGHTVFAGSHPGRITNINVGISRYNGLLVQPNEIFSFDDHLGPVDGQHGYVKELVITDAGTLPDYGGGLCQVSSTLYQAALLAGFPILERANHSYAVSYYAKPLGYGLDATIYPGVHDVKFKNDSPSAFVIQSYTENGQAYFKFYGTDDGRKVWLDGPTMDNYKPAAPAQVVQTDTLPAGQTKQVEINHTGFDVTWYRYIVKNGVQTKEKLFTRYDNTPAKIMVGTGTSADQMKQIAASASAKG